MRTLILVGLGGFFGSISRYLVAVYFTRHYAASFPYGTFAVNIVGCLAIGVFFGLSNRFEWFSSEWRLLLITGFCGGFTTFSSFAFENFELLQAGQYQTFALYSLLSFSLCILAVFLGMSVAAVS